MDYFQINTNLRGYLTNFISGILRRQLARPESVVNEANQNQFRNIETTNGKTSVISMDREMSNYITESTGSTTAKINIQDEFIEEEQTDSDVDPEKPDAQKKKKKIYRCKRCNKLCNSKNALHYHFLSHTGERPHQCDFPSCGKSFFASSALKVSLKKLLFFIQDTNFNLISCRFTSDYTVVISLIAAIFAIDHSASGVILSIIFNRSIPKRKVTNVNSVEKILQDVILL